MAQEMLKNYLPAVDFQISATGITVNCKYLTTARFIPFEVQGKCQSCKCDGVEIDFVVSAEGVILNCPRMTGLKYICFDLKCPTLPNRCIFRVRTKGKVFNIPVAVARPEKANEVDEENPLSAPNLLGTSEIKKEQVEEE
jgi:hypothetical protein